VKLSSAIRLSLPIYFQLVPRLEFPENLHAPDLRSRVPQEKLMRICSLLPSATEILFALDLGDCVAGVTHECDFPSAAAKKPALIRPRVDPHAAPAELDRQVRDLVARGESIYAVDACLLSSIAPDLIVTQDLCHVCAASPDDLATALTRLPKMPQVLSLTPHCLADVWNDIRRVGQATDRCQEAETLAAALEQEISAIASVVAQSRARPRVLCLEWLDPFYVGGHWVPEMVAKAGGEDVLGRAGQASFRVTSEQILQSRPDVIVVMPCGYNSSRAQAEFGLAKISGGWGALPAVRNRRIFAVDANSYFSRPGPRLADGVALLAHILHPDLCKEPSLVDAYQSL
jgi:iron complex transport system substrate-binding protein